MKYRSDQIISARTGEGKTLCFLIPIINRILEEQASIEANTNDPNAPTTGFARALILSPTRELAKQIKYCADQIIPKKADEKQAKIRVCELIGEMSVQKQARVLKKRPEIIVGTVGRVWDMLDGYCDEYLSETIPMIDFIVLDEADRMVEAGKYKELGNILDYVYTRRTESYDKFMLKGVEKKVDTVGFELQKEILGYKNLLDGEEMIKDSKTLEQHKDYDSDNIIDLDEEIQDIDAEELILDDEEIILKEIDFENREREKRGKGAIEKNHQLNK